MENQSTFKMTYSAQQQEEIRAIRNKYAAPEENKMDRLRQLDAGTGRKARAAALTVGTVGTLLLGTGMSLAMSEFGSLLGAWAMPCGIAVGLLGIAMVAAAYPAYSTILKKQRRKIAPEILRLTDELMQ